MHDWKRLHRSFERLLSAYTKAHENEEVGRQLLRQAMNPDRYERADVEREAASLGVRVDLNRDWAELTLLREAFEPLSSFGYSASAPAESVYQTAIQVQLQRLDGALNRDGQARWFYRGQRNREWNSTPKLLRDLRDHPDSEMLLDERLQQLRSSVASVICAGMARDELEAVAIIQHYSRELRVSTWLLDVTRSPWVALFFASDDGTAGDIGQLEYIEVTEWMRFSNSGDSALGYIRIASPHSVLRIRNQNAFFLEAPHPDLFADLSVRKLYFRQVPGVVFEDDASDPPIHRDFIYPREDPTLMALRALPPGSREAKRLTWEPTGSAFRAPTFEVFLPIAHSLLEAEGLVGRAECSGILGPEHGLEELCRLHAAVRTRGSELGNYVTTLHHLRRLVTFHLGELGLEIFLELHYLQYWRDDPTARRAFRTCLAEASPRWAKVLEEKGPALGL